MIDLELLLEKFDSQKIHSVYDRWPEIAENAWHSDLAECRFSGISHIVFAGMGGSGAIGSIFASILSKTNVHVSVVKGYLLPKTADSGTLVVTTSTSGDTAETLTVLDSAKKADCKILACSSGGKMEKYCKKNNIEHRKVPLIHSPRASFTNFLYSMLRILDPVIPTSTNDVNESIRELGRLKERISSESMTANNPSVELARWVSGIPLIYYPAGLQAAAIRFKNSLQENSKMHAITEDVIEACHNGIVSWEHGNKSNNNSRRDNSNILPILIRGNNDYIKTEERWGIVKEFFDSRDIEYRQVFSGEGSILTKMIRLIYMLDYTSIYRAVLSEKDPTPIGPIDFVKKRL